jgi:hypothetical protein
VAKFDFLQSQVWKVVANNLTVKLVSMEDQDFHGITIYHCSHQLLDPIILNRIIAQI